MKRTSFLAGCLAFLLVASTSGQSPTIAAQGPAPPLLAAHAHASPPAADVPRATAALRSYVGKNCVTCHSERIKSGGVSLQGADLSDVAKSPASWERAVRKIRAGMMPPAGSPAIAPQLRE